MACTDADTLSVHHTWCHTLTRGSGLKLTCVPTKQLLIPSLVPRHVSRRAHCTQHFLLFCSLSSTSPPFTPAQAQGWSRPEYTAQIHETSRGEGFPDPEPRTGYEPKRTEQEIEHSAEESQIVVFDFKILLKALLRLKKSTWTTNKFVLCWLHHGVYRSEKQVQNDHKLINLKEKVWCQVHLKVWSSWAQGKLRHGAHIRKDWVKTNFQKESNVLFFKGVVNQFSETLTQRMLRNLSLMESETTCLLERDLNWWSRNTKWNLLAIVLISFSNRLMLNDWNWRTPITDMLNLDENKFDYKKNVSWKKKLLEKLEFEMCTRWEKWRELKNYELTIASGEWSHATIQELTSQILELPERMNHMNDAREFQDVESICSGTLSHVPSQPAVVPSLCGMQSRDQSLRSDKWN